MPILFAAAIIAALLGYFIGTVPALIFLFTLGLGILCLGYVVFWMFNTALDGRPE